MAVISAGQITIIDLHDAPVLNAWISASQTTVQTYNNTAATWSPNYPTTAQVLTLNLTKAGSPTSIISAAVSNIVWTKRVGTTTTTIASVLTTDAEYKSGTAHSILTTKVNVPIANNAIVWNATGTWTDPITGLPVDFAASIDITVIQLAKAAVIGNIYAPEGDTFRNDTPATLIINADLYKDGTLSAGSKKFKWFAADSSVMTSQDTDGGVGWRKITTTSGDEAASVAFDGVTTGQGTLTVKPVKVLNAQTYKVVITDNVGGTSGTKVTGLLTLRDMDDPIQVVIDSTEGNILKNGTGSTTLKARLFQQGAEVDAAGSTYVYKWYKWQDGSMVSNFGGTGITFKTGKSLVVANTDVSIKTVFKVEVNDS